MGQQSVREPLQRGPMEVAQPHGPHVRLHKRYAQLHHRRRMLYEISAAHLEAQIGLGGPGHVVDVVGDVEGVAIGRLGGRRGRVLLEHVDDAGFAQEELGLFDVGVGNFHFDRSCLAWFEKKTLSEARCFIKV